MYWNLLIQKDSTEICQQNNKRFRRIRNLLTRMLLLQATVKRFQLDLYVNLEGQEMLISSWFQQEFSEANHRARRSAGEKLNISPLDIGHKLLLI